MKQTFIATRYQGKPAVLDTVARVYYFGYRSMDEAARAARDLNEGR